MASVSTASTLSPDLLSQINGSNGTAKATSAEGQGRFLKLLTTQLRNQDPLNPMDNAQMTSQLAQISTVDGITRLNATLEKLVGSQQGAETLQAAVLVGRDVLVEGKSLQVAGAGAAGGVELGADADRVEVTIRNANGIPVRTISLGELDAGTHKFAWDGKSTNGTQAVDGKYTISVSATRGSETVKTTALALSTVNSVLRTGSGSVSLDVGSGNLVSLSDIKQIL